MANGNNNVVDPNKKNGNATADPSTPANAANSVNNQIWGEGGSGYEGFKTQLEKEIDYQNQHGNFNHAYTSEDVAAIIGGLGLDPNSVNTYSQTGSYIKDGGSGVLPGTGEEGWSLQEGKDRPVAEGTSGADERFLSDGAYAYVQYCKDQYANAKTAEERNYWHNEAEKTRAGAGYSGGIDGSMYITSGQLGVDRKPASNSGSFWRPAGGELTATGTTPNGTGTTPNAPGTIPNGQSDLNALLEAWQTAALNQSEAKTDYAVQQAVAQLERALADAQPQFKEQAESVDRDARQAMDNSALYAEMRGDKGGIGQEQYNSIQNTAAQNHLAVQQAQTKLATDTQRQIADLRAQGDFEKADAALQITQQYLQQLVGLEQWAKEYNLSVEQFNASLRQWEAEYNLAMQQFQTGVNQWQQEFAFQQQQYANSLNQWQQEFDYSKQSDLANVGWALLESGIPLSEAQMSAMGIDPGQASQVLMQQQLEAALKDTGSGKPLGDDSSMDYTGLFEAAKASGHPQSFIANNYKKYGFTSSTGLYNDYKSWEEQPVEPSLQDLDLISVSDLGIGAMLSYNEIERMVEMGVLTTYESGDKIGVKWANGWNAAKWKASDKGLGNGGLLGFQGLT